jgi:hypothetical protein
MDPKMKHLKNSESTLGLMPYPMEQTLAVRALGIKVSIPPRWHLGAFS